MKKYRLILALSILVLSNLAVVAQSGRHTLERELTLFRMTQLTYGIRITPTT